MDKELLMKAASLCREAAEALKMDSSPEKQASEVVEKMVSKGMLQGVEKERYTQYLAEHPEKLAAALSTIDALPARASAIGEISNDKVASGIDAMDSFIYT